MEVLSLVQGIFTPQEYQEIKTVMPKVRVVRLAKREGGLATETIRRVQ